MRADTPRGDFTVKTISPRSFSSDALGAIVRAFSDTNRPIQFRAKGESMFPLIKTGDVIRVSPYAGTASAEPGDIIAYMDASNGKLVIHRLIRLKPAIFVAKGDYCFHRDAPQPVENILGYISRTTGGKDPFCGIDFLKLKKTLTLCSTLGLTAVFGRCLKLLHIIRMRADGTLDTGIM